MTDRLVSVCSRCRRASCWQDAMPCERANSANVIDVPYRVLEAEGREHPSWFSEKRIREVNG